ncbi:MAG: DUF1963 domain-containing protein [Gammaproteobacteria bacterium]|nr:DUF1963 domain-containing protein [Gammaproteobacteria bacterium]
MGTIIEFFRKKKPAAESTVSFEELLDSVRPHFRPALRLRNTVDPSTSFLGGLPKLPQSIPWPEKDGRPLSFLAAIDLSSVANFALTPWLPAQGHLLFFYDIEEQPWGFDPNDRGSWSVIYTEQQSEDRLGSAEPLTKSYVDFESFDSIPDWQRFDALGISLSEAEVDTYVDGIYDTEGDDEEHQIGGYPGVIQGDTMELECQLASNNIYVGGPEGYNEAEAEALRDGAEDWRLLFQHSGDDEQGLMWGDCGRIYFWVKEQDAQKGDFSNAWLILQCS